MDPFATSTQTITTPPVGPYRDFAPHAKGGLGEVLKANDADLHRVVAIKRLQGHNADDAGNQRRFRLEAEITARLEHPGVVPVYALLKDEADRPSYAMRFIEGQTFAEAIAEYHKGPADPIAFRRLLQCFLQVCQTVAYAHSRGVLHRDLKPANVMLGKFGETLVVDWGLAKVVDRPDEIRETSTETTLQPADVTVGEETALGSAVGTPAYMSPEQAAGRWDVVNTASDIYGLGAVLYTLLTGRPPLTKGNWPELLQKIQRGDYPQPRQVKADAAPALEAICLKAMALEPGDRYKSAQALAADIERWLAGEPVLAWREPLRDKVSRWMRRHKSLVSGVAVLLLTVLIGAAVGLFMLERKNKEIASERNTAITAAAEAQSVNAFLTEDLLGQADPDVNNRMKKVTVEELLHKAARKIEGNPKFAQQPELEATIRLMIGKTFFKLGDITEAEKHLRQAMTLRRQALGADDPRTLDAQEALADFCNRGAERFLEAERLARQTWEARARVLGPDHRDTLDSLDTYATALIFAERYDEAEARHRECLASRRRALGPDHVDTIVSINNLAFALIEQGKWSEARKLLLEALDKSDRQGARSDHAMSNVNLAMADYLSGNLEDAENRLQSITAWSIQQFGPDHPVTDRIEGQRQRIWLDQNRLPEAVELGQKVVARRIKIFSKDHRLTAYAQIELGRALVLSGKHAEAAEVLAEAERVFVRKPRQSYMPAWGECWRGAALAGLGRFEEAETLLRSAERKLRDRPDVPQRHYREVVQQLARISDG